MHFQFQGDTANRWIDALVARQADAASHREFEGLGYVNAAAFSWTIEDLASLPDIVSAAQTFGAITGPAPLWCQLRLHPDTERPLLRIGIDIGGCSITKLAIKPPDPG